MAFSSLAEIDAYMKTNKCEFWEAVIREEARDSQQPEMDIVNRMTQMYRSMKAEQSWQGQSRWRRATPA